MHTVNEIINFLKELSGAKNITPDTDIYKDLGMVGDDFHEMIEKYASKYSVNMDNYLWYFHTDEEGQNLGGLFFAPPYKRVDRIPVTPKMLDDFANTGKWDIEYPTHKLPRKRIDLLINWTIVGVALAVAIVWIITKLVG